MSIPRTLTLVGATLALAAGCASHGASPRASATTHQPATSSTAPAAPNTDATPTARITIKNFAFGAPITVRRGASVTVVNSDDTAHTVTADNGSFNTNPIFGGTSTHFNAPPTAGIYTFHCNIHANMHGKLIVTN